MPRPLDEHDGASQRRQQQGENQPVAQIVLWHAGASIAVPRGALGDGRHRDRVEGVPNQVPGRRRRRLRDPVGRPATGLT